MQLTELLTADRIVAPLRSTSLSGALDELTGQLETAGAVHDAAAVRDLLTDPAEEAVAMDGRTVLVHVRTAAVGELVLALGASPDGFLVDDGDRRSHVLVLVLAPPDAATLYLQTLSSLSRLLHDRDIAEAIAHAGSPQAILSLAGVAGVRIKPSLTVRDVMQRRVHTVGPDTPVRVVVDLLIRHGLRSLPVVGEKGDVLGIVGQRNIMAALLPHLPRAEDPEAALEPERVANRAVREIMSRSILCVSEDMGLREVANMMLNKDVDQVPVVRHGALTGLVTRDELVRKLFKR